MEPYVSILRDLWRVRVAVCLFAVLAILVGAVMLYRPSLPPQSRTYEVGTATAYILLDTPASQVVEVAPAGSETLGSRASLIANLMAQGDVKAAIARHAGVPPGGLLAIAAPAIEPQ